MVLRRVVLGSRPFAALIASDIGAGAAPASLPYSSGPTRVPVRRSPLETLQPWSSLATTLCAGAEAHVLRTA